MCSIYLLFPILCNTLSVALTADDVVSVDPTNMTANVQHILIPVNVEGLFHESINSTAANVTSGNDISDEWLIKRITYRITQSDGAAWASFCLFSILVIVFGATYRTRLWETHTVVSFVGFHDQTQDLLGFQTAAEVSDSKAKWKKRFSNLRKSAKLTRKLLKTDKIASTSKEHLLESA